MLARTHIATALLAGILFLPPHLPPHQVFVYFIVVILFALVTDLDHPDSTISHAFPVLGWITSKILKHRGLLHSLVVPFVLWLLAWHLEYPLLGMGIAVGMVSHLFCDALTKNGINVLHPFSELRLHGFIRTGGRLETMFFWIVIVVLLSQGILAIRYWQL